MSERVRSDYGWDYRIDEEGDVVILDEDYCIFLTQEDLDKMQQTIKVQKSSKEEIFR